MQKLWATYWVRGFILQKLRFSSTGQCSFRGNCTQKKQNCSRSSWTFFRCFRNSQFLSRVYRKSNLTTIHHSAKLWYLVFCFFDLGLYRRYASVMRKYRQRCFRFSSLPLKRTRIMRVLFIIYKAFFRFHMLYSALLLQICPRFPPISLPFGTNSRDHFFCL